MSVLASHHGSTWMEGSQNVIGLPLMQDGSTLYNTRMQKRLVAVSDMTSLTCGVNSSAQAR